MAFRLFQIIVIIVALFWSAQVQAKPLSQTGNLYVHVCYDAVGNCMTLDNNNSELISYNTYLAQVLANEWPGTATSDSLKAGVIAIRTFVYRPAPCGTFIRQVTELPPITTARLVNNGTQRYRIQNNRNGTQNTVATAHTQARDNTDNVYLYRTDGLYACAKYNANNGNPTQSCASGNCTNDAFDLATLQETIDPVDSNNAFGARYAPGMSANGSAGWAWAGSLVPWDYRQILTHYYTKVKIGSADTNYRWVWLNVSRTTVYNSFSGQKYFMPIPGALTNMRINATYKVRMHIQNTGTAQWTSGTTPYQLIYQWCDTNGANCSTATGTTLGTVNPGVATEVFVNVTTPAQSGERMLKWDIKKPDGALFSTYQSQDWPTQKTTVTLRTLIGNTFTPWVASGSVTAGSQ